MGIALFFLGLTIFTTPVLAAEIHFEYSWWDPSFQLVPPPPEFASCPACHKSLGVSGDVHSSLRKYCLDCHMPGRSGPYSVYAPAGLRINPDYAAPKVYYHVANLSDNVLVYNYSTDPVEVPSQSHAYGGDSGSSCFGWNPDTGEGTCHGISNASPVDGNYAFNLPDNPEFDGPGPFMNTVDSENLPDTTDCMYCHRQSSSAVVSAWANPVQTGFSHFESETNQDCYNCHVEDGTTLTTFHVMGPEPEVIYLTTTTTTTTTTSTTTTVTIPTASSSTTLPAQNPGDQTTTTLFTLGSTAPPTTGAVTTTIPSETVAPDSGGVRPLYLAGAAIYLAALAVVIVYAMKRYKKE